MPNGWGTCDRPPRDTPPRRVTSRAGCGRDGLHQPRPVSLRRGDLVYDFVYVVAQCRHVERVSVLGVRGGLCVRRESRRAAWDVGLAEADVSLTPLVLVRARISGEVFKVNLDDLDETMVPMVPEVTPAPERDTKRARDLEIRRELGRCGSHA